MVSERAVSRAAKWRRGQKGDGAEPDATAAGDVGTPLQRGAAPEQLALHRARFVEWDPSAAVALAASGDGSALAVAREGGGVEVWETDSWTRLSTLAGPPDLAVTSLVWLRDAGGGRAWRLFSGGLDGSLTEWDLANRRPKHRTDALGGAVWAIAAQPASDDGAACRVAVACDDGCLRLFTAEAGQPGLAYEACLPPARARLLCCAWHPSGNTLVAGSADGSLHAWGLATRRELLQVRTGDETRDTHEVWACGVLADGTLVTGDGGGNVQFWDAQHGSLVASHRRHAAHVVALAASPDGARLAAAGADHQVALFQRVPGEEGQPPAWEYAESKRPHTHDVRAMAVVAGGGRPPLLVTGGCDAQLFAYRLARFTQEHAFRLTAAPEPPAIQLAAGQAGDQVGLLLAAQRGQCDLWRLGAATEAGEEEQQAGASSGGKLPVAAWPRHLARLASSSSFAAAALSADGSLLAAADAEGLHLYAVQPAGGSQAVSLQRRPLRCLPQGRADVQALAFSGRTLLLASAAGVLTAVDTEADSQAGSVAVPPELSRPAEGSAAAQAAAASLSLAVSACGRWAALVRPWEAHVVALEGLTVQGHVPAGEVHGPITAAAFDPAGELLALGTADNALLLHETGAARPAAIDPRSLAALAARLGKMPGSISGIAFLPSPQRRAALVSTPGAVCFVDLAAPIEPLPAVPKRLRRKRRRPGEETGGPGTNARVRELPDVCLACGFAGGAAVLVERGWAEVLARFPPPVYRHRYGA